MRWSIFLCGAGLLCLGAWIDNMRGPLLPVITKLMNLDYSAAGIIMALGNLVAMSSTWLLMPLLNRWSLRRIGISVIVYSIVTCTATIFVSDSLRLFIWGAVIGGCISTMGSLSNLFVQNGVSPSRRGQIMAALHSIYGLSSFFAPWIAGLVLVNPQNWQMLFASVAPIAMGLGLLIFFKGPPSTKTPDGRVAKQPMRLERLHILTILVLIAYVLGEVLVSTWMPSFLVQEYGLNIKDASLYASMFFGAMLVSRVATSLWVRPRHHRMIIWASLICALSCFCLGRITGWLWLLPLTGLFGPFFPLYVTWVGLRFPERDRSMIIWMLSGMQAALGVSNLIVGKIADRAGFGVAYWLPAAMILMCMILLKALESREKTSQQTS